MKTEKQTCATDDYDFYTIPFPIKELLHNNKSRYISAQLEKLHPCFSDSCTFDSHFRLERKGLKADVVVMQKYKVAEYKALHKRLFVKERKHIQFFSGRTRWALVIAAAFVLVLLLFMLSKKEQQEPLTKTESVSSIQKLYTPELISLINSLNGKIFDFAWTYDGYTETASALVQGVFPEQFEVFTGTLKLSPVTFDTAVPKLTVNLYVKNNQFAGETVQTSSYYKNELRKLVLQKKMILTEETVNPFGLKLLVPQNQSRELVTVLQEFLQNEICLSSIKINSSVDNLRVELISSEMYFQVQNTLIQALVNNLELFEQSKQEQQYEQEQEQEREQKKTMTQKTVETITKVGQIIKPDGTIAVFYKDENGKIIKR